MKTEHKTFPWRRWLTVLALGLVLLPARARGEDDLNIIGQRMIQTTMTEEKAPKPADAARLAATLGPDGRWPDINYADQARSAWEPMNHLRRLLTMARVYRTDTAKPKDALARAALKAAILRGYDAWFVGRPTSLNWWWMPDGIGTHLTLAPLMLLMKPELSRAQLDKGLAELKQAWWGIGKGGYENVGQNLVWRGRITLMRAVLTNDLPLAREAMRGVTSTIVVTGREGIQADWSFHQHGPQLYSGGYGASFTGDMGDLAALTEGTSLALSPEQAVTLGHYVLDGQQWMVRGQYFDYSVVGREITRAGKSARNLIAASEKLAQLRSPRSAEFMAFSRRMADGPSAANPYPHGNRSFWRSDYMAQQGPHYLTSVRMSSLRTRSTEIANGEGLLSYYLGDGVNLLYRRGDEYAGIFPVWDWTRLPGVTCELAPSPPAMPAKHDLRGTTVFVGGVSDGAAGMAALDYARGNVAAHKSWFLFDGVTVCLGAGITGAGPNPVVTSINQCLLKGPVTVGSGADGATTQPGPGERRLAGARWVFHDGVGYFFPDRATAVVLKNEPQTGSWTRINAARSNEPVSLGVFSLWLDHGVQPQNAAYQYLVVPGITLAATPDYATRLPVKVVQNIPACQAVWLEDARRSGIAFFAAGSCQVHPGLRVTVYAPCLVLLHEEGGAMTAAVSDPTEKRRDVQLDISAHLTGDGAVWQPDQKETRLSVTLPNGQHAGESVMRHLKLE